MEFVLFVRGGEGDELSPLRLKSSVRICLVQVDVTANHKGFFTFKLCANNNTQQDPRQQCFDQNLLKVRLSFKWSYFCHQNNTVHKSNINHHKPHWSFLYFSFSIKEPKSCNFACDSFYPSIHIDTC